MSQYTVKPGDTLWIIAEKLLGNENKYTEIQRANNLRDDTIHPDQVLTIPGRAHSSTTHRTTKHDASHDSGTSDDDDDDDTISISVCSQMFYFFD